MKKILNHYIGNGNYIDWEYNTGDSFCWTNCFNGTHGCQDSAVFQLREDGRWVVTHVENCHSCWQVGHDENHCCGFNVGDIVDDPPTDTMDY